jgi:hypothetical protein
MISETEQAKITSSTIKNVLVNQECFSMAQDFITLDFNFIIFIKFF